MSYYCRAGKHHKCRGNVFVPGAGSDAPGYWTGCTCTCHTKVNVDEETDTRTLVQVLNAQYRECFIAIRDGASQIVAAIDLILDLGDDSRGMRDVRTGVEDPQEEPRVVVLEDYQFSSPDEPLPSWVINREDSL